MGYTEEARRTYTTVQRAYDECEYCEAVWVGSRFTRTTESTVTGSYYGGAEVGRQEYESVSTRDEYSTFRCDDCSSETYQDAQEVGEVYVYPTAVGY